MCPAMTQALWELSGRRQAHSTCPASWASEQARLETIVPNPASQGGLEAPSEEAALKTSRWENPGTGIGSRKSWVPGQQCWDGEEGNHKWTTALSQLCRRQNFRDATFFQLPSSPTSCRQGHSSLFLCLSKCSPGLP